MCRRIFGTDDIKKSVYGVDRGRVRSKETLHVSFVSSILPGADERRFAELLSSAPQSSNHLFSV